VTAVAFSPDGKWLATGCWQGKVDLWNARIGKHIGNLNGGTRVQSLAYSPDKTTLTAAGDARAAIRRWDMGTDTPLPEFDTNRSLIRALAYSPDGKVIVAADLKGDVHFFSPDGEHRTPIGGCVGARAISFRPDGKEFAVAGDGGVWLCAASGKSAVALPQFVAAGNRKALLCIDLRADGRAAATGDALGDVRLWDADTGKCTATLGRHTAAVVEVRFGPDAKVLVSRDARGGVRTWDPATGKALATLRETPATDVGPGAEDERQRIRRLQQPFLGTPHTLAPGPQGTCIAASDGTSVRVWNGAGKVLRTFELPGTVTAVACAPDGKTLIVEYWEDPKKAPPGPVPGRRCRVAYYDLATGTSVRRETDGGGLSSRFGFAPNGKALVFAAPGHLEWITFKGDERYPEVKEVPTGAEIFHPIPNALAVSPDGRLLAVSWVAGGGCGIALWDVKTGQRRAEWAVTLDGAVIALPQVSMAFRADSKGVVLADVNGTIRTWELPAEK
jgi:WD40 repeat protein